MSTCFFFHSFSKVLYLNLVASLTGQNLMLIMAEKHTAKKGKFYNSKYQDKWATLYQICPVNINSFAVYVIPCKKNISF